jgi:hydrogenase maturation protease
MVRLLVLGVGNILLSDDGVGVRAVEALLQEQWPENVTFLDGGTFTQDIYYLFKDYDRLLVLDVIHAGHPPGTVYTLSEDDLIQNEKQRLSIHDVDLIDSLKMAELAGYRPEVMRIVGMEPADITTWSMDLTSDIQNAFPHFLDTARKEIRAMLELDGGADRD